MTHVLLLTISAVCSLHLQETETIALPASVVQVAPFMAKDQESAKEGTDQKLKLNQEEMKDQESTKVQ